MSIQGIESKVYASMPVASNNSGSIYKMFENVESSNLQQQILCCVPQQQNTRPLITRPSTIWCSTFHNPTLHSTTIFPDNSNGDLNHQENGLFQELTDSDVDKSDSYSNYSKQLKASKPLVPHLMTKGISVQSYIYCPSNPIFLPTLQVPINIDMNKYSDVTSLINSNSNIIVPQVESRFIDHSVCTICGKRISRDMARHMRIHGESRFECHFPKYECHHKSGRFNRPYDFKKHLLNHHFKFDDVTIRRRNNLGGKLYHQGTCSCGLRFLSIVWLYDHILTEDSSKRCPSIQEKFNVS